MALGITCPHCESTLELPIGEHCGSVRCLCCRALIPHPDPATDATAEPLLAVVQDESVLESLVKAIPVPVVQGLSAIGVLGVIVTVALLNAVVLQPHFPTIAWYAGQTVVVLLIIGFGRVPFRSSVVQLVLAGVGMVVVVVALALAILLASLLGK